mmetsp:Transcript_18047/g.46131  ORF Transcript_18047/g.46131 Transcript_18047/m.46131 type:complete len:228 (+) Transcript_18047:222-905(+)
MQFAKMTTGYQLRAYECKSANYVARRCKTYSRGCWTRWFSPSLRMLCLTWPFRALVALLISHRCAASSTRLNPPSTSTTRVAILHSTKMVSISPCLCTCQTKMRLQGVERHTGRSLGSLSTFGVVWMACLLTSYCTPRRARYSFGMANWCMPGAPSNRVYATSSWGLSHCIRHCQQLYGRLYREAAGVGISYDGLDSEWTRRSMYDVIDPVDYCKIVFRQSASVLLA